MGKTYKNTPKGRSKLPSKPGTYNLKNRNGETVYTGMTKNLNRRIKEHHYSKSKHFSYITITLTKSKQQAKMTKKAFAWGPLKELMERNGAELVARNAVDELISYLEEVGAQISSKALESAKHAGRKKVTQEDMKLAMRLI